MAMTDDSDAGYLARRWSSFVDGWPGQAGLADMPPIGTNDDVPELDRIVHAHLFAPGLDVWVTEADAEHLHVFGFGFFAGRERDAEWGFWELRELAEVRPFLVERDRLWQPCPVREVDEVRQILEMRATGGSPMLDQVPGFCCSGDAIVGDILQSLYYCDEHGGDTASILESISPDEVGPVIRHLVQELEHLCQINEAQAEVIRDIHGRNSDEEPAS